MCLSHAWHADDLLLSPCEETCIPRPGKYTGMKAVNADSVSKWGKGGGEGESTEYSFCIQGTFVTCLQAPTQNVKGPFHSCRSAKRLPP